MSLLPPKMSIIPADRLGRRAAPGDRHRRRGRIRSLGLLAALITLAFSGMATVAAAGALSFAPAVNYGAHAAFAGSDGYAASARTATSNTCTRATASRVATRLHVGVDPFLHRTPIFQVLCGPFFGPGTRGMAASVAVSAGCGGSTGWAVFRYAAGKWRLVMQQRNGAFLAKAGSDIRERRGDPRRGDPHCAPSAWKTRIWHWNGRRFTAGPWNAKAPKRPKTVHLFYVRSPSHNLWCDVGDEGNAYCVSQDLPHSATLALDGTLRICNGRRCVTNNNLFTSGTPVLAYGQRDEQGGYRCASETKGITCTVISGSGKGRGFLINSAGVRRVGP